jgi:hypothetical protein
MVLVLAEYSLGRLELGEVGEIWAGYTVIIISMAMWCSHCEAYSAPV